VATTITRVTKEYFYIIAGRIKVTLMSIVDNTRSEFFVEKGDIIKISPNVVHTFYVLDDAQWINFLSQPMKNDDDFIKYKVI